MSPPTPASGPYSSLSLSFSFLDATLLWLWSPYHENHIIINHGCIICNNPVNMDWKVYERVNREEIIPSSINNPTNLLLSPSFLPGGRQGSGRRCISLIAWSPTPHRCTEVSCRGKHDIEIKNKSRTRTGEISPIRSTPKFQTEMRMERDIST